MHLFFFQQTFAHFFFAFVFLLPKGMLTNYVDLQKGGEANFTSCMKGPSSLCHVTSQMQLKRDVTYSSSQKE